MKNLKDIITEKLRIKSNDDFITVKDFVDALYNYGPSLELKDIFGRKQIKIQNTALLDPETEATYEGSRIYEIYYRPEAKFKNEVAKVTFYGVHHKTNLSIWVRCEDGEEEKLYSMFKPGVLETIYKYLIDHRIA